MVGTLASTNLTARLRAFREAHPGVRLTLRTARSDGVSALVQQGGVALGLRYLPDPSPAIVSRPVQTEELVVVCAAHSNLADLAPTEPAVLAGVPWIGFASGAGSSGEPFARLLERQLLRAGLDAADIIAVDSLTAQERLAEADFGLLPASSIEEELRSGTLRLLPVAPLATTVPIHAIHRRHGYLAPVAHHLPALIATSPSTSLI